MLSLTSSQTTQTSQTALVSQATISDSFPVANKKILNQTKIANQIKAILIKSNNTDSDESDFEDFPQKKNPNISNWSIVCSQQQNQCEEKDCTTFERMKEKIIQLRRDNIVEDQSIEKINPLPLSYWKQLCSKCKVQK